MNTEQRISALTALRSAKILLADKERFDSQDLKVVKEQDGITIYGEDIEGAFDKVFVYRYGEFDFVACNPTKEEKRHLIANGKRFEQPWIKILGQLVSEKLKS